MNIDAEEKLLDKDRLLEDSAEDDMSFRVILCTSSMLRFNLLL